jgi:hypothetical protein
MIRVTLVFAAAILLGACAGFGKIPPPPTTAEVVQLTKDGVPPGEIIQRMNESRAVYRLSDSELAQLRAQGVQDEVINHMQQTYLASVRDEEWYRARQGTVWPHYPGATSYTNEYPYPYPNPFYYSYPYRYQPIPR